MQRQFKLVVPAIVLGAALFYCGGAAMGTTGPWDQSKSPALPVAGYSLNLRHNIWRRGTPLRRRTSRDDGRATNPTAWGYSTKRLFTMDAATAPFNARNTHAGLALNYAHGNRDRRRSAMWAGISAGTRNESSLAAHGPRLGFVHRRDRRNPFFVSNNPRQGQRRDPVDASRASERSGRDRGFVPLNPFSPSAADAPASTLDLFNGQPTIHGPLDIIKFLLWPIVGKTGYREEGAFAGVAAAIQTSTTAGYPLYMGGLRFGRMWNRHLEVMFEPIPALFLKQNSGRFNYAYGLYGGWRYYFVAVNPNRTWRFEPYVDLLGGIYNSIRKMPTNGSVFSFSAEGGIGARTFVAPHFSLEAGVRVVHISDAHIAQSNPSYNGVMGYVGLMYVW